jgi:peptidoglycan/xylan/chitin deacetylase (PgdA/CDA1 family)
MRMRRFLACAALALCCALLPAQSQAKAAPEIAFTFDDLPVHGPLPPGQTRLDIAADVIATWKAQKMPPVYGFVNGIRLQQEPLSAPALDAWREAGFPLGSHTWSHMDLNRNTLAAFEADIAKNEPLLRAKMSDNDWRWLRFPYLNEGDTPQKRSGVRAYLRGHGYKIAAVTMSFSDYLWNEPYGRCSVKKDRAAITGLEKSYLKAAAQSIAYYRGLSHTLYRRDIPYVLLMQIGAFDARMLPRLIALYRSHGFKFVTLKQAESDPFYRNDLDLTLSPDPDTLEAAMLARHIPMPPRISYAPQLNMVCR